MSCEKIAGSFCKLLETYPYSKITIQMICEQTPISKNSFYYHFSGKKALAEWICIRDYKKYSIPYFGIKADNVRHKSILSYIKKKRKFYEALYAADDGLLLYRCLLNTYIEGQSHENLSEYIPSRNSSPKKVHNEVFSLFISAGIAEVVVKWIRDGMKVPVEELASDLTVLFTRSPEEIITDHLY